MNFRSLFLNRRRNARRRPCPFENPSLHAPAVAGLAALYTGYHGQKQPGSQTREGAAMCLTPDYLALEP